MTRTGDLAPPVTTAPPHTPWSETGQHLIVAVERLPESAYTWDDADPDVVWAAGAAGPMFSDAFDTLDGWIVSGGPPTIVAGRTGTAMRMVGATVSVSRTVPADEWVTVGFGWRADTANVAARTLVELWGRAGVQRCLYVQYNGTTDQGFTIYRESTGQVLGTSAPGLLPVATWGYVELRARIDDTAGQIELRVNGATVISATGLDTRPTPNEPAYDQIRLTTAVGGLPCLWDDLYLDVGASSAFRGPGTIPPGWTAVELLADELVWDAPDVGGGMTDVVCDFISVALTAGPADEDDVMPAAEAVVTLANVDGRYSTRSVDGRLVYWAPGRKVQLLGRADGQVWWLFSGRVSAWDENLDGTVTITAHDGFAQLAAEPAGDWTPGTDGQTVAQRVTAVLAQWGYTDPVSLAATDVVMANTPTDRSPLEELQTTALSDGGLLFVDADSRLTYRARDWTTGRADQTVIPVISDNRCDVLAVWDLELVTDDVGLASTVQLENTAVPPLVASATLTPAEWARPYVWTHPDPDLWKVQADGNRLATDLLARYSNDAPRFTYAMHLRDPNQDLWRAGVDLRIGDKVTVVRDYPAVDGPAVLDVDALVVGISHEITPDVWTVSVETGRVVAYRFPEMWDATALVWDEANPRAVWSY